MGFPEPQISIALIVFVLTEDGRTSTIGGEVSPLHRGGLRIDSGIHASAVAGFEAAIRAESHRCFPPRTTTSSFRPLMPRLVRGDSVVLPFWATGRLPLWSQASRVRNDAALAIARSSPSSNALERLAAELGDPSIVAEAESELRRTLASDPIVQQMVSEGARVRALAKEALVREPATEQLPPVLALLPEEFTIEQLRVAIGGVGQMSLDEVESSSNFRRRLREFIDRGLLAETGEAEGWTQKGRPPRLYRFVPGRWRDWLAERAMEPARRDQHKDARLMRLEYRDAYRADVDQSAVAMCSAAPMPEPEEPQPPPMRKITGRRVDADKPPADAGRVARLEAMLRELAAQVSELSKRRRDE